MSFYKFILPILLISSHSFDKRSSCQYNETPEFNLEVFVENDTLSLSRSNVILAQLRNKTSKAYLVPTDFDISSNLFPQGDHSAKTIRKSANFYFHLEPPGEIAGIIIENDMLSSPIAFTNIKPGAILDFTVDILNQINDYNKYTDNDSLQIKPNDWYKLRLSYSVRRLKEKGVFSGTVNAKEIQFYLVP